MSDDGNGLHGVDTPGGEERKVSYAEELRRLGLIEADEFICIAQDIPPYTELPVTD